MYNSSLEYMVTIETQLLRLQSYSCCLACSKELYRRIS